MDATSALKYSVYYHLLTFIASFLGLAVAAVGVFVGLRGALAAASLSNPLSVLGGLSLAGVGISIAGFVGGFFVWRVGTTAARIKVETTAVEEGVDVPSTSVISRKVAGEVSTQVGEEVSEAVDQVTPDDGFEFGGDDVDSDAADAGTGGTTETADAEAEGTAGAADGGSGGTADAAANGGDPTGFGDAQTDANAPSVDDEARTDN